MKEKLSLYLVATVKRIGALWVGFLVSIIPVYVCRASIHDIDAQAIVEPIVTSVVVLLSSVVFLFFLHRMDDVASKLDNKEIALLVVVPTLIHFLICVITAFTKNLIVLSTGMGYIFINLLEPNAGGVAELSAGAKILASLIVAPIPALGVWLGCISARKKRQKDATELHKNSTRL